MCCQASGSLGGAGIADSLWARPALSILGVDCPPVVGSAAAITPKAAARLNLRIPPGMDVAAAESALTGHLEAAAPWGARVTVRTEATGAPFLAAVDGPAYHAVGEAMREVYGRPVTMLGQGGSIPLCTVLATTFPNAEIILMGVEEPRTSIHAPNESVDPGETRGHGDGRGRLPVPLRNIIIERKHLMASHSSNLRMTSERTGSPWAAGIIVFAGILMIVGGIWHALAGFAALLNDDLYVSTPNYVYAFDLTGWGWGHLVLGVLVAAAGGAVLRGLTWGRVVGLAVVLLSLVANFLFIPWYPVWSLVIIALDIAVIWALIVWPRQPFDA